MFIEEGLRCQDHSWCAESTLKGTLFDESLLKRMKFGSLPEAFDREDLLSVDINGEREARKMGLPIDENRACPARPQIAPALRSGESQVLPQHLQEGLVNLCEDVMLFPIDVKLDDLLHNRTPFDNRFHIVPNDKAQSSNKIKRQNPRRNFSICPHQVFGLERFHGANGFKI